MSIRAMNNVFEMELEPKDKIVLLVIADHADADGYCWPGQATLARRSSIPERTLRRVLQRLEEAGLITRERRVSEDGRRQTDGYHLSATLAGGSTGQIAQPTGQNRGGYRPTVAGTEEPSENHQKNTPPTPSGSDLVSEWFEEAWKAWPRKEGKAAAKKAWLKAARLHENAARNGEVQGAPVDAGQWGQQALLRDTVCRFGAALGRTTAPRFIPHLSTWLNQERWTDPLPVDQTRGAYQPEPQRAKQFVVPPGHRLVRDEMGHIIGTEPVE